MSQRTPCLILRSVGGEIVKRKMCLKILILKINIKTTQNSIQKISLMIFSIMRLQLKIQ